MALTNDAVGRRGFIQWKKGDFVGKGWECDYDTYTAYTMLFPLYLGSLVHFFNVGKDVDPIVAISFIPLRKDRGFKRAAFIDDAGGMLIGLLFFIAFVLGCGALVNSVVEPQTKFIAFGIGAAVFFLLSVVALIYWRMARVDDHRDVDIRLVLGRHEWGSSDPVYWTAEYVEMIAEPARRFHHESYAKLAQELIGQKDWVKAMWAARLSAAKEDLQKGEALTDSVLQHPDVQEILATLRKAPEQREKLLGQSVSLTNWVTGVPEQSVMTMTNFHF